MTSTAAKVTPRKASSPNPPPGRRGPYNKYVLEELILEHSLTNELKAALFDIQRYLLDQIPPLTAAEAIETLMHQPPELLMQQVHTWVVEQARRQDISYADLIFHALRKVYLPAALQLIDDRSLNDYLDNVTPLALKICPADEKEVLRASLVHLRDTIGVDASGIVSITRSTPKVPASRGGTFAGTTPLPGGGLAKRMSIVLERLAAFPFKPKAAQPEEPAESSHLISMATQNAKSEAELNAYLRKLERVTGPVAPEKLFHALAAAVPQWDIVLPENVKPPAAVEAMQNVMNLTPAVDAVKRYRELIGEAVEQFNAGALGSALAMLEVAARAAVVKNIDRATTERIREGAVESINPEQLRKYAEEKSRHPMLRKTLGHFPALTKEGLFGMLRGEKRPERRRAILGLLEAYGSEARNQALAELENELAHTAADVDTYYLRNVVYLLHRIPREPEESVDREMGLLTKATGRGQNIYVIKEAIIPLGTMKGEAAVKLLTMRLAEIEAILVRKDTSMYPADEMQKVLDRICVALGKIATPAALLTIARHGMKPNPLLGDTRSRLTALSQHDLSFDEQTVDILVKAIRDDLPTKLLGRILPARQPPPLKLIEALFSTRAERVEQLFHEIVEKYGELDVGKVAAAALANLRAPARQVPASATLTGNLAFFGLPSLLQSLAEQRATGIVTLTASPSGLTAGKILFVEGKFAEAQVGVLRGTDALYQLLELPVTGTFAFVPQAPEQVKTRNTPLDVMGLLFEGIRRHDELRQMMIFVPDDLILRPTQVKPTMDPEETDPTVLREAWVKVCAGTPVAACEREMAVDAYRVRRLVSRWLEEGALERAA